jgi:osmoprotectant transport system permease protein
MSVIFATDKDSFLWWQWVVDHTDEIRNATFEHLRLTLIAVVVGFAISLALAGLALRYRFLYGPIAAISGVLYTIPSLALFGALVTITGFTTLTAEIALVSYTLLIFVRNIVEGVDGVPASVKEAADGMGYRRLRRFFSVELRLAAPALIAGLRIVTVTTVGLVTVAGLIGLSGYGFFINEGLKRSFSTEIVVGAGLSMAMAIALDIILLLIERVTTPWTRRAVAR